MKREFLESYGLSEEVIDEILGENGRDIELAREEGQAFKRLLEEKEGELGRLRTESAVDMELGKFGAKNLKAVKALLDMEALGFDENGVTGLTEQLEKLREENGFLFDGAGAPRVVAPSSSVGGHGFGFNFTGVR